MPPISKVLFLHISALLLATILLPYTATAEIACPEPLPTTRFQPYGNNYMIYPQLTRYNSGHDDDTSMEGHYSFKYILYDRAFSIDKAKIPGRNDARHQVFFSYTGEFDFYVNFFDAGRDSGPVINRTSNPALHWTYFYSTKEDDNITYNLEKMGSFLFGDISATLLWSDLSFEHRSDGQATDADATDASGQNIAQQEYLNDPNSEYFDSISMGANYFKASAGFRIYKGSPTKCEDQAEECENPIDLCDSTASCFDLNISTKIYFPGDDTDITWGPLAGTDTNIRDYDILRLRYSNTMPDLNDFTWLPGDITEYTIQAEYTMGKKGLETDSMDLKIIFPVRSRSKDFTWPWFVDLHSGPMDRLANYTEPMTSFGIGLMFSH